MEVLDHPCLHGQGLYRFLEEAPPPVTITVEGQSRANPSYSQWNRQDQLLLSWIRSSLSKSLLAQVVSCNTSSELWKMLQQTFSASYRARLSELRRSLQTTTKGGMSCADYCQRIRAIVNELTFIGSPVSDDDLVLQILGGLGSDFNNFVVAANTKDHLTFSDLQAMLLSHESLLQSQTSNGNLYLLSS